MSDECSSHLLAQLMKTGLGTATFPATYKTTARGSEKPRAAKRAKGLEPSTFSLEG